MPTLVVPRANAETQIVHVGLLQVPIEFDGQISSGEYSKDAIDYRYFISDLVPSRNPEAHLYVKHDSGGMTYFGIDIPSSTEHQKSNSLRVFFDTLNTGKSEIGTPGVYELYLKFSSPSSVSPTDTDTTEGTAFRVAFNKGSDYDWKYAFAPSPLSSANHSQFEVEIRTAILTKNSTDIGFYTSYADEKGILTIPEFSASSTGDWARLSYEDVVVPELGWVDLAFTALLVAAVCLVKRAGSEKQVSPELCTRPA